MTDLERLLELVSLTRNEGLSNIEYDEMMELESKLNEKLEKAEKYDSICDSSATEYMVKLEQQIKQLKEELEKYADWFEITPKTILTVKTIFDVNQQYSNHIMDLIKEIKSLKSQNEKLQKVIDEIRSPEFLEKLASIEHNQWTEWAYTLMSTKSVTKEKEDSWYDYFVDYEKLPENIKELDRKYARIILKSILSEAEK